MLLLLAKLEFLRSGPPKYINVSHMHMYTRDTEDFCKKLLLTVFYRNLVSGPEVINTHTHTHTHTQTHTHTHTHTNKD